jgi:hypothetical protein
MSTIHFKPRKRPPDHPVAGLTEVGPGGGEGCSAGDLQTELAQRSSAGVDVTLLWVHQNNSDSALVIVHDQASGAYFEIQAEPYAALDVYYHPFAYRDFSTLDSESRWATAQVGLEGIAS